MNKVRLNKHLRTELPEQELQRIEKYYSLYQSSIITDAKTQEIIKEAYLIGWATAMFLESKETEGGNHEH